MTERIKAILFLVLSLHCCAVFSQLVGEEHEPTPEYLDATFDKDDVRRVAAGFSDAAPNDNATSVLGGMTEAADLVVRGQVLSQEYDYDERGVPSTHTTFLISEKLKGEGTKNQLTLVQRGGPAQNDPDKIMMTSHAHYFNVGEEEVLFLETDPVTTSPFLRVAVMARYRIFQDRVYSEDGHGVVVVPLQNGKDFGLKQSEVRNPDPSFKNIYIGTQRFEKKVGPKGSRFDTRNRGKAAAKGAVQEGVDANVFVGLIRESVGSVQ